jgi:SulP family sulfate permease
MAKPRLGDATAAIAVALVLIPQCLAYAELAGMPAYVGLLAASIPPIVAAPFGSSRFLQTGPTALTAIVTFGALSTIETPGTAQYVALGALMATMLGFFQITFGTARLGRVAFLMTPAIVAGFTSGAALLIASSQLPSALGSETDGQVIVRALRALQAVQTWEPFAILLTCGTGALVLFGRRRFGRRFPGVLIAVVIGVAIGRSGSYPAALVGSIPNNFPSLKLDLPWNAFGSIFLSALVISFVQFAEPSSIARGFAERDDESWDASRELSGQGIANLTSGLFGGFPVGGSFSRSSLNRLSGGETRWVGVFVGLLVLAFLPLASVLETLPKSVLAATVIIAVQPLFNFHALLELVKSSHRDALLAIGTLICTLVMAPRIHYAVIAAVGVSLSLQGIDELKKRRTAKRRPLR